MRRLVVALLALCMQAAGTARAQDRPVSFNLSTDKTFSPGEQPKIHLYTHNVDALEFRIYRVHDPVKFMENLRELHSFGPEAGLLNKEEIDERTTLEKFHDWKESVWSDIHAFFRHQFSSEARQSLREKQSSIQRHSRIVSEAEFAQVPLLNSSQLVARWRQLVPSTFMSDNNILPVPKLDAGLYLLEATDGHYKAYTLVMVSQMALMTRVSSGNITTFAVDRVTGRPIDGVQMDAGFGQGKVATGKTATDGTAALPFKTPEGNTPDNFWVVAVKGAEFAVSTPETWALSFTSGSKYAGYAFTERPVYRPTHTVHWKAILRERNANLLVLPKPTTIHVKISDESDKAVFERDMPISAAGEVTGDYELPKDASLGYYTLSVGGEEHYSSINASFHVEDYRKPEYRVQVSATQKRVLEGSSASVTIDSRYFFGEPVLNAKVKYRIYHKRHYWWGEEDDDSPPADTGDGASANSNDSVDYADQQSEQTGKLDADGRLVIQVPTQTDSNGTQHYDQDYTVEAGVTDAANREITGRGRFLATYGTFRINIEPLNYSLRSGDAAKFRVTAVDYDDMPVSTHVHVQLSFNYWDSGAHKSTDGPSVEVTTDATGHATGEIPIGAPKYSSAELTATASAVQKGTRDPSDSTYLWIAGTGDTDWDDSSQQTQIIADKKSYAPGDIAHLSIVSDTPGLYALAIVEGSSLLKQQVLHTDTKTVSFDVPITTESQPNITVSTMYIRNSTLYQATKVLKVPPTQQHLQVKITPSRDTLQPQQTVSYDVQTQDADCKPVSATVSFGVVDEAIYSLYPDESGDMVARLYPQRNIEAQVDSSLQYYFSGEAGLKSPMLAMRNVRFHPQLAQVKPGNEAKPKVRKAFPDTAFWAPNVHTDSSGHAKMSFAFPDSLTTWRTTVHAITADSKAGSAINRVLVRKNILVRMGTPRFLIKGDEITLPVIAHNYLDTAAQATISLKVEGLDNLSGSSPSVTIPSRGEATVFWRLKASQVGTAKLTASAVTAAESDALELSFPVQPAGVAKAFSKSGVVNATAQSASAEMNFPVGADVAAHTVHVEVSPSIAGALFPALQYLTSFPYGCTEQTMSSFLPNVIVADTLKKLNLKGRVDEADLGAKTQAGLARLKDYQHDDGGWGWWKEDDSRINMTSYVVGGLGQAQKVMDFNPDQRAMLFKGRDFLRKTVDAHPRMRPELRAAAVYALAEAGDTNLRAALDAEWERRNDLDSEALALMGLAMLDVRDARAAQVSTMLTAKAKHQGALVFWESSYLPLLDVEYKNDAEATAYVLRLLSRFDPNSAPLAPAAQWLMLSRDNGFWWTSTEQTAMVLFGLVDYLAASHELSSDFTTDVLLNGQSIGQHHFTSADALSGTGFTLDLTAAQLQPGNNTLQIVRRSGTGPMYWSARGQYFTTEHKDYQAGTMSLNLTRDYFKLVPTKDKNGNFVYALQMLKNDAQIGDVLAVHTAINGAPMRYLLLEDPIPAGTEFVANEDSYTIQDRPGGWRGWYTRKEFHDDHAAVFASDFDGRQEVFYLIRVVNPGVFQVSPAHVEPMYQPEIQATSDAFQLRIPAPTGGTQ